MQIIPIEGLNAIAWTMTTVCVLLTIGRFWIHSKKTRGLGWDDYLNGIALVFLLVFIITYQIFVPIEYQAQLAAIGAAYEVPADRDMLLNFKLNFVNVVMFFCVIYSVKASFLALYWRIFEVSNGFRIVWWALTAYTVLSFAISIAAVFWHCGTPRDFMNVAACAPSRTLTIHVLVMWCVLNVVGDLLLMIIPLAMLKPLKMPTSQKLGVVLVFSLVLISIAFDILRTVYTLRMRPEFQDENTIWALLEPTIAVIVCALPCYGSQFSVPYAAKLGAFFGAVSSRFTSSTSRSEIQVKTDWKTSEESLKADTTPA